jgi:hypothetical protein
MSKTFERAYPYAGAILCGFGAFYILRSTALQPGFKDLVGAVVNVSAISVGFLATAKSLLLSLSDRSIISRLKQTGHFNTLVGYFLAAVNIWLLLALVSSALLYLYSADKPPSNWYRILVSFWAGLLMAGVLSYMRAIGLLSKILRS